MTGALSLFACDEKILRAVNFTTELQHIEHHPWFSLLGMVE